MTETPTFSAPGVRPPGDPASLDPDEARPDEVEAEQTLLDGLVADLKKAVSRPPVIYVVPDRPTISIEYDANISVHLLRGWQRKAFVKRTQRLDEVAFSVMVLVSQCRAILRDGKRPLGDDGQPLTFSSEDILDALGVDSVNEACRALYGNDLVIATQAAKLLSDAGFGEEPDEIDVEDMSEGPTRRR